MTITFPHADHSHGPSSIELIAASAAVRSIPMTKPNGPKLSMNLAGLSEIERSCRLSNYGPINSRFEHAMIEQVFHGIGECVTVCNATIGLILALKYVASRRRSGTGNLVLMPSFTFAAAAHAVLWAGLTPLLVDVDVAEWSACRREERKMLERYGSDVAAVMPYATFGSNIDLAHYDRLSDEFGIPVVIDAAASLGAISDDGKAFGTGSKHIVVFSMHATKAFAVGEGGLVYSGDRSTIESIRRMGNFGFDGSRSAVSAGLNSKISEVAALSALVKLGDHEGYMWHRMRLADAYRARLHGFRFQKVKGLRIPHQFMPVLLPKGLAAHRDHIIDAAAEHGIGVGKYFSPHVIQQPYFKKCCIADHLPATDRLASRILSLPISDTMTIDDVEYVVAFLENQVESLQCAIC